MSRFQPVAFLLAVGVAFFATIASAVPISFTSVNLGTTGISETVVLNDNIIAAMNVADTNDRTVNGVLFKGATLSGTSGSVSETVAGDLITLSYASDQDITLFPGGFPAGDFRNMMREASRSGSTNPGSTVTLTLTGLPVGEVYRAQFLFASPSNRTMELLHDGTGSGSFTLGGTGSRSVVADFTADGSALEFVVQSANFSRAVLNAVSLAQIPVPEPSSVALLLLGGVLTMIRRKN